MGSQSQPWGGAFLGSTSTSSEPLSSVPSLSPSHSISPPATLRSTRAPQSSSQGSLVIESTVPFKSARNRLGVDRILCDTSNGLFTPSAVRTHRGRRKGLLCCYSLLCLPAGHPSPAPNFLNPNPNPHPRTHPANQPWNPKAQPSYWSLFHTFPHGQSQTVSIPNQTTCPATADDKAAIPRAVPSPVASLRLDPASKSVQSNPSRCMT